MRTIEKPLENTELATAKRPANASVRKRGTPATQSAVEPLTNTQPTNSQPIETSILMMSQATCRMLGCCALTIDEILKRHANLRRLGIDKYGKLGTGLPNGDESFSRFSLPMRRRSPIETADIVVISSREVVGVTEIFLAEEVGL